MKPIIFDIETGPQPIERIKQVLPSWDPDSLKNPGEFCRASVKLGALKDQAKIDAKIEAEREKHAKAVADYEANLQKGESQYWAEAMDRAALSAATGTVLAIGYLGEKELIHTVANATERELLIQFWSTYQSCRKGSRAMVGFNCGGFDIPFIIQRSWQLGVPVPGMVFTATGFLDLTFVDLMKRWQCGNRSTMYTSLDAVCKALGIEGKSDGITGADFARLFNDESTRPTAIEYLSNDLRMTAEVADRIL